MIIQNNTLTCTIIFYHFYVITTLTDATTSSTM